MQASSATKMYEFNFDRVFSPETTQEQIISTPAVCPGRIQRLHFRLWAGETNYSKFPIFS
jgi:hypothetical protein